MSYRIALAKAARKSPSCHVWPSKLHLVFHKVEQLRKVENHPMGLNKSYIVALIVECLAPVMAGGSIYLLFRPDSLLMFSWIEFAGFLPIVEQLRYSTASICEVMPSLVVYSLPNGLWCYALVRFIVLTWRDEASFAQTVAFLAVFIAVLPEMLQGVHIIPGTFASEDLAISIVFSLLALNIRDPRRRSSCDIGKL